MSKWWSFALAALLFLEASLPLDAFVPAGWVQRPLNFIGNTVLLAKKKGFSGRLFDDIDSPKKKKKRHEEIQLEAKKESDDPDGKNSKDQGVQNILGEEKEKEPLNVLGQILHIDDDEKKEPLSVLDEIQEVVNSDQADILHKNDTQQVPEFKVIDEPVPDLEVDSNISEEPPSKRSLSPESIRFSANNDEIEKSMKMPASLMPDDMKFSENVKELKPSRKLEMPASLPADALRIDIPSSAFAEATRRKAPRAQSPSPQQEVVPVSLPADPIRLELPHLKYTEATSFSKTRVLPHPPKSPPKTPPKIEAENVEEASELPGLKNAEAVNTRMPRVLPDPTTETPPKSPPKIQAENVDKAADQERPIAIHPDPSILPPEYPRKPPVRNTAVPPKHRVPGSLAPDPIRLDLPEMKYTEATYRKTPVSVQQNPPVIESETPQVQAENNERDAALETPLEPDPAAVARESQQQAPVENDAPKNNHLPYSLSPDPIRLDLPDMKYTEATHRKPPVSQPPDEPAISRSQSIRDTVFNNDRMAAEFRMPMTLEPDESILAPEKPQISKRAKPAVVTASKESLPASLAPDTSTLAPEKPQKVPSVGEAKTEMEEATASLTPDPENSQKEPQDYSKETLEQSVPEPTAAIPEKGQDEAKKEDDVMLAEENAVLESLESEPAMDAPEQNSVVARKVPHYMMPLYQAPHVGARHQRGTKPKYSMPESLPPDATTLAPEAPHKDTREGAMAASKNRLSAPVSLEPDSHTISQLVYKSDSPRSQQRTDSVERRYQMPKSLPADPHTISQLVYNSDSVVRKPMRETNSDMPISRSLSPDPSTLEPESPRKVQIDDVKAHANSEKVVTSSPDPLSLASDNTETGEEKDSAKTKEDDTSIILPPHPLPLASDPREKDTSLSAAVNWGGDGSFVSKGLLSRIARRSFVGSITLFLSKSNNDAAGGEGHEEPPTAEEGLPDMPTSQGPDLPALDNPSREMSPLPKYEMPKSPPPDEPFGNKVSEVKKFTMPQSPPPDPMFGNPVNAMPKYRYNGPMARPVKASLDEPRAATDEIVSDMPDSQSSSMPVSLPPDALFDKPVKDNHVLPKHKVPASPPPDSILGERVEEVNELPRRSMPASSQRPMPTGQRRDIAKSLSPDALPPDALFDERVKAVHVHPKHKMPASPPPDSILGDPTKEVKELQRRDMPGFPQRSMPSGHAKSLPPDAPLLPPDSPIRPIVEGAPNYVLPGSLAPDSPKCDIPFSNVSPLPKKPVPLSPPPDLPKCDTPLSGSYTAPRYVMPTSQGQPPDELLEANRSAPRASNRMPISEGQPPDELLEANRSAPSTNNRMPTSPGQLPDEVLEANRSAPSVTSSMPSSRGQPPDEQGGGIRSSKLPMNRMPTSQGQPPDEQIGGIRSSEVSMNRMPASQGQPPDEQLGGIRSSGVSMNRMPTSPGRPPDQQLGGFRIDGVSMNRMPTSPGQLPDAPLEENRDFLGPDDIGMPLPRRFVPASPPPDTPKCDSPPLNAEGLPRRKIPASPLPDAHFLREGRSIPLWVSPGTDEYRAYANALATTREPTSTSPPPDSSPLSPDDDEVSAALEYFLTTMANDPEFQRLSLKQQIATAVAAVTGDGEEHDDLTLSWEGTADEVAQSSTSTDIGQPGVSDRGVLQDQASFLTPNEENSEESIPVGNDEKKSASMTATELKEVVKPVEKMPEAAFLESGKSAEVAQQGNAATEKSDIDSADESSEFSSEVATDTKETVPLNTLAEEADEEDRDAPSMIPETVLSARDEEESVKQELDHSLEGNEAKARVEVEAVSETAPVVDDRAMETTPIEADEEPSMIPETVLSAPDQEESVEEELEPSFDGNEAKARIEAELVSETSPVVDDRAMGTTPISVEATKAPVELPRPVISTEAESSRDSSMDSLDDELTASSTAGENRQVDAEGSKAKVVLEPPKNAETPPTLDSASDKSKMPSPKSSKPKMSVTEKDIGQALPTNSKSTTDSAPALESANEKDNVVTKKSAPAAQRDFKGIKPPLVTDESSQEINKGTKMEKKQVMSSAEPVQNSSKPSATGVGFGKPKKLTPPSVKSVKKDKKKTMAKNKLEKEVGQSEEKGAKMEASVTGSNVEMEALEAEDTSALADSEKDEEQEQPFADPVKEVEKLFESISTVFGSSPEKKKSPAAAAVQASKEASTDKSDE